jgi:DNA-binding protein H-NS
MARSLDLDAMSAEDLMRLLEEIFDRLPAQALLVVRDVVDVKRQEKLEDAKGAVLEETRAKLAALGLTLADVLPLRKGKTGSKRSRRDAGRTLPVKYRGPEGHTWSGRGHVPTWLQALEEAGRTREEFSVSEEA